MRTSNMLLAMVMMTWVTVDARQCRIWGACKNSPGCCPSGTQCYKSNKWYSQCRPDCPKNWDCNKNGGGRPSWTPRPPRRTPEPPVRGGGGSCEIHDNCHYSPNCCPSGAKCVRKNPWYSQCLPDTGNQRTPQPPYRTPRPPRRTPQPPRRTPQPPRRTPEPPVRTDAPSMMGDFVATCRTVTVPVTSDSIMFLYTMGKVGNQDAIQFTFTYPTPSAMWGAIGFRSVGGSGMKDFDIMAFDSVSQVVTESLPVEGTFTRPTRDPMQDSVMDEHFTMDGHTTVSFHRLLNTGNDFELGPGKLMDFGWAVGPGRAMKSNWKIHTMKQRGVLVMQEASECTNIPSTDSPMVETPMPTAEPRPRTPMPTDAPIRTDAPSMMGDFEPECRTVSIPVTNNDVHFLYTMGRVGNQDAIQFTFTYPTQSTMWGAIGFRSVGGSGMKDFDIMAFDSVSQVVTESVPVEGTFSRPTRDPMQDSVMDQHFTAGGKTTVSFHRLLNTGNDFELGPGKLMDFAWAVGEGQAMQDWKIHSMKQRGVVVMQERSECENIPSTDAPVRRTPEPTAAPQHNGGGNPGGRPGTILNLDFEDEALNTIPRGWGSFTNYVPNQSSATNQIHVDDSKSRSGRKSLKVIGGSNSMAQIVKKLDVVPQKLYFRAYFWMEKTLGNMPGDNHEHIMGTKRYESPGRPFSADSEIRIGQAKGHLGFNQVPTDAVSPPYNKWFSGPQTPAKQWTCIEAGIDRTKTFHEMTMWMDDNMVNQVQSSADWHAPMKNDWTKDLMGNVFFGWHSFSQRSMNMWIDDIVISDERIMCN